MAKTADQKLTPKSAGEWKPAFLAHLRNTANVRAAAKKAGVTRQAAYKAKGLDAEFAAAWDDAIDDAVDLLEEEAWRRARSESDTLLIFLMKAHRPGMYRDKPPVTIDSNTSGGVQIYLPEKRA